MQDDLDAQILTLLQKDGKLTYEQIGDALSRSSSTIRDRIKKMEEDRTILGYSAIVDPARVGIGSDAYLSADIDPEKAPGAMTALFSLENISEILHVTGERRIFLRIKAGTCKEMTEIIDRKIRPLGFQNIEVTMVLDAVVRYPGL
jgi:DNA-binding Lrp family transcriptional regulator